MLVVELQSNQDSFIYSETFPDGHYVSDRTPGWVKIYDENKREKAAWKADVVHGYQYKDDPKVPVDTLLNHLILKRDYKGRFVGKK